MSKITVESRLWHRLADIIQDMGNHHPLFANTPAGADLDTLGCAVKYGVPQYPGADVNYDLCAAIAVIEKHDSGRPGLTTIEQAIETAEKILGLWVDGPGA